VAAEVIASQAALELAVHVQSRLVVIETEPVAPSAGADSVGAFSSVTWHLTAVGAVTEIDDDVPLQAVANNDSAQNAYGRARTAEVQSASALPHEGAASSRERSSPYA